MINIDQIHNYLLSPGSGETDIESLIKTINSWGELAGCQPVLGAFWLAAADKQVKFLSFLRPEIVTALLKSGLSGASRQAGAALRLLKENYIDLIESLQEEILVAAQGDSIKVCLEAGILLLQNVPDFLSGKYWFLKRLASIAEAPTPVKDRLNLIELLCRQVKHHSCLQIEAYPDRDEVVAQLLAGEKYFSLALYLRSAFNKWQPATSEPNDLIWLCDTYRKVKDAAANGQGKGELTLEGQSQKLFLRSKLLLEAAVYEAAASAADALIRCINGPGGEHLWTKFTGFMTDRELAEEFMLSLSRDPRALALLSEDMVLDPTDFSLTSQEIVQNLTHGVLAAQHCLKETLKLCLNIALKDQDSAKLCLEKLNRDKSTLEQYAPELFGQMAAVNEKL